MSADPEAPGRVLVRPERRPDRAGGGPRDRSPEEPRPEAPRAPHERQHHRHLDERSHDGRQRDGGRDGPALRLVRLPDGRGTRGNARCGRRRRHPPRGPGSARWAARFLRLAQDCDEGLHRTQAPSLAGHLGSRPCIACKYTAISGVCGTDRCRNLASDAMLLHESGVDAGSAMGLALSASPSGPRAASDLTQAPGAAARPGVSYGAGCIERVTSSGLGLRHVRFVPASFPGGP